MLCHCEDYAMYSRPLANRHLHVSRVRKVPQAALCCRYMPTYAAVVVSALGFAACHFSVRDFPQLTALGILLGFTYVRSRNLLTPMIIHGAWNGVVLTFLYFLVSSGVDVQQLLAAPTK